MAYGRRRYSRRRGMAGRRRYRPMMRRRRRAMRGRPKRLRIGYRF